MTNVSLNIQTRQCVPDNLFLGYEGENEVNKLIFKFTDGFFDGAGLLNVKRGEQKGYVALEKVGETYELDVKNSLLSQKGDVIFQLAITSTTGTVIKFDPFVMTVKDSIDTESELPEEYPSWIDEANAKLAEIDKAIKNAEETTTEIIQAKENGEFNGKDGEDGYSPSAKVTQTEYGALIEVTDAEGTTTAMIQHGSGGGGGGGIVTETDPTVPGWAKQPTKPTYNKEEIGLGEVDNIRQYSTNNPPPYPVTSVNGETGDVVIEIPEMPNVPTKLSQLENDSQFATEEFVKNKIAEAELGGEGGEIDLSGYATKEELDNKVDKVAGKSLVNDTEIARLKNVDNYDDTELRNGLNNKAEKSEIPTVPTKVSSFENDSNYATEEFVENEIATFDFIKVVDALPETGLPNRIYFVPKSDTGTQDLFDEYVWVNNQWEWITTKQIVIDLTEYVKRSELSALATKEELADKQDKLSYSLVTLSQTDYDALVSAGTIDENTYYFIKEEE